MCLQSESSFDEMSFKYVLQLYLIETSVEQYYREFLFLTHDILLILNFILIITHIKYNYFNTNSF